MNFLPKRTRLVSLLLSLSVFRLLSCNQNSTHTNTEDENTASAKEENLPRKSFSAPGEFHNYIINEQKKIARLVKALIENSDEIKDNKAKTLKRLEELEAQARRSLDSLNAVNPYEGGEKLLAAAKTLFRFYSESIVKKLRNMIAIIHTPKENYTAAHINDAYVLFQEAMEKEKVLDKAFKDAEAAFARQHRLEL